jgi:hypothetical protein
MLLTQSSLESIHRFSHRHRPLVEQSKSAGCFHCGATFAPADVTTWIDDGETACCPKCGLDAVLPSAAPVFIDTHLLAALQKYWFSGKK